MDKLGFQILTAVFLVGTLRCINGGNFVCQIGFLASTGEESALLTGRCECIMPADGQRRAGPAVLERATPYGAFGMSQASLVSTH